MIFDMYYGFLRHQIVREHFRALLWVLLLSSRLRTDLHDPHHPPRPLPGPEVPYCLGDWSAGEESDHGNFGTLEPLCREK